MVVERRYDRANILQEGWADITGTLPGWKERRGEGRRQTFGGWLLVFWYLVVEQIGRGDSLIALGLGVYGRERGCVFCSTTNF